ncbi:hypothetical protein ULMS_23080 [Patiriisocius marinistellae]|uniref:Glycosyltransferase family 1 protein n=1 Tax=Patiriisocius marinistellae TaxID=2494560 RepID=A0A5J4FX32_9FLAO|nr:glycosyltransferase family 4 protein [Patiriisocius marinistellae]GEQ86800.1 hypothetical protein ULMS_23080 [Patiriisocius marinistellae]
MMHIVFISNEYPTWAPGGKGTFIQTFARELVKVGHRVTVLGIGDKKTEEQLKDEEVLLIRLRKPISPKATYIENSLRINSRLNKIHKEHAISIVETSELDCAYLPKNTPFKKVIRLHGGHHFFAEGEQRGFNPIKARREKKSFANADAFIAVSKYVKDHTAKFLSYHTKPIAIINYPIDTDILIPEVKINPDKIVFAGTVCEKKGVFQLIEAFQLVKEKHPSKQLEIFGRDWFYPTGNSYIKMLTETFSEKQLSAVTFHGAIPRDRLYKEYASSLFCIFPSHMETQGLVTLEAMLMEKPVVFSIYGPGPETIDHMHTGLLSDVRNPKDIAEKMLWCINNQAAAQSMGKKGRKAVLKKFDKKTILAKNIKFYQSL